MKRITGRFVLGVLLAFFGIVVGVNALMMHLAISTMPGVEVENAFSAGLSYPKEIADARRQDQRRWTFEAHVVRAGDGRATLDIDARDAAGMPITGLTIQCRLERPTDRRSDMVVTMREIGNGAYRGAAVSVAPGQWDIVIESRAADDLMFLSRNRVNLTP